MPPDEKSVVAEMWHESWHRAHASLVPAMLVASRTLTEFEARLAVMGDDLRVIGPVSSPTGLCAIRSDELYQIYVSPAAEGTGIAARLLSDGEARLAAAGHKQVWLACVAENSRACRFYAKHG